MPSDSSSNNSQPNNVVVAPVADQALPAAEPQVQVQEPPAVADSPAPEQTGSDIDKMIADLLGTEGDEDDDGDGDGDTPPAPAGEPEKPEPEKPEAEKKEDDDQALAPNEPVAPPELYQFAVELNEDDYELASEKSIVKAIKDTVEQINEIGRAIQVVAIATNGLYNESLQNNARLAQKEIIGACEDIKAKLGVDVTQDQIVSAMRDHGKIMVQKYGGFNKRAIIASFAASNSDVLLDKAQKPAPSPGTPPGETGASGPARKPAPETMGSGNVPRTDRAPQNDKEKIARDLGF